MPKVTLDGEPSVTLDSSDKIRLQVYIDLWDDVIVAQLELAAVPSFSQILDEFKKAVVSDLEVLKSRLSITPAPSYAHLKDTLEHLRRPSFAELLARLKTLRVTIKGVWDSGTWDNCTWDISTTVPNLYKTLKTRLSLAGE